MSNDEPTTAAEMELLATVQTVVDEAEEKALQEDLITLAIWWDQVVAERAERGEVSESKRRTLLAHLKESLPRAELLVEQARRRARGDQ